MARLGRLLAPALLALSTSACAPLLMPPPVHFGETAKVLDQGRVSVGGQAGIANGNFGVGGGGAARVRYGLGGAQEVGLEGLVGGVSVDNGEGKARSTGMVGGAKASYKVGATPWLAFLGGVGFGSSKTGETVGGDVGAVASYNGELWQPYLGARVTAAWSVSGNARGSEQLVTVPLGIAFSASQDVSLYLEVAPVFVIYGSGGAGDSGNTTLLSASAGVTFQFGGR